MLVLGIETSCDETGVSLYESATDAASGRLLAHAVHSQVAMHEAYGGVVPELASRDHIQRLVPLTRRILDQAGRRIADVGGIGYTEGPGLAGALLVGASFRSIRARACFWRRALRREHRRMRARYRRARLFVLRA